MDTTFDQLLQVADACTPTEGLTSLALMGLPDELRKLLNKMIRKGALPVSNLATEFGLNETETQQLVERLEAKGFVASHKRASDAATVYQVRLARTREFNSPPPPTTT